MINAYLKKKKIHVFFTCITFAIKESSKGKKILCKYGIYYKTILEYSYNFTF